MLKIRKILHVEIFFYLGFVDGSFSVKHPKIKKNSRFIEIFFLCNSKNS